MGAAPQITQNRSLVTPQCPATGAAAALARAYLDFVSGCWRGDPDTAMGERFASYFGSDMPEEPTRIADAYSPHGAGGRGITWYECGDTVLGYVPGATCGYVVPLACIPELGSAHATATAARTATRFDNAYTSKTDERRRDRLPALAPLAQVVFTPTPATMGAVA